MRDIFSKTEGRKSLAFLPGAAHLPHPSLDDLKTTITKKKKQHLHCWKSWLALLRGGGQKNLTQQQMKVPSSALLAGAAKGVVLVGASSTEVESSHVCVSSLVFSYCFRRLLSSVRYLSSISKRLCANHLHLYFKITVYYFIIFTLYVRKQKLRKVTCQSYQSGRVRI